MKKAESVKLDKLWKEAIHKRDVVCQVCGKESTPNAHHVIGRRNHSVRWDLDNGIILCSGCHTMCNQSAHQDPLWFTEWFIKNYPDRYDSISAKRNLVIKRPYQDWVDYIKDEICDTIE